MSTKNHKFLSFSLFSGRFSATFVPSVSHKNPRSISTRKLTVVSFFSFFICLFFFLFSRSLYLFLCIHLYTRRSFFVVVKMTWINVSFIHLLAFCLVNYFYTVHSYLYWEYALVSLLSSHNHDVFVWIFFNFFHFINTIQVFLLRKRSAWWFEP